MNRLASFHDVTALMQILEREYGLQVLNMTLHRNMGGVVYFVKADTFFVFKIFRHENTENALQSIQILQFLQESDYPAVRILPTQNGEAQVILQRPEGECVGVLYPFLEGEEMEGIYFENTGGTGDTDPRTPALGEQIGLLHKIMLSEKAPRLIHRGKEFYIDRFIHLLERDGYDAARIQDFAEYGTALWSKLAPLPQGFCHGDLHTGNMILNQLGFVLFDFDISSSAFPVIDVATLCDETHFNQFDEAGYDKTRIAFDAFYQGYSRVRTLSDAEIRGIFDFIPIRHFELFATILFTHKQKIRPAGIDEQYDWMLRWQELCAKKRL